jgi:hypothetical protein
VSGPRNVPPKEHGESLTAIFALTLALQRKLRVCSVAVRLAVQGASALEWRYLTGQSLCETLRSLERVPRRERGGVDVDS